MGDLDDDLFAEIFAAEGAIPLLWEAATRCTCYSPDSRQPQWGHTTCQGTGAVYAAGAQITGLFRGRGAWFSQRAEGELAHGEAQLTTPMTAKPSFIDLRVRDRFTVLAAAGDVAPGTVFFPATEPVPFIFAGAQRAWRVQLQSLQRIQLLNG